MWRLIDSDPEEHLALYARGEGADRVHMIRVDGWELMNGAFHGSEDRLGRLAAELVDPISPEQRPRILIGGLGLGYTLASVLRTLAGRPADIVVAERSAAVLRWFGHHVDPAGAAALPQDVRLEHGDVIEHLQVGRDWDVIALDVDNGPAALSAPGNAALYDETGLVRCRDSLRRGGHVLLWSSFDDAGFVRRAEATGFAVASTAVPLPGRPDQSHLLYRLTAV